MKTFTLVFILLVTSNAVAQSGTVFKDYNGNGTKDANEPGVTGILIKSYKADNTLASTATSGSSGTYTLSPVYSGAVRVEFEIPVSTSTGLVSSSYENHAISGSVYGTAVQFVTASATNVNFAIANTSEYTGTSLASLRVAASVFSYGHASSQATGSPLTPRVDTVITTFGYNSSGVAPTTLTARAGQAGCIWGLAYQKESKYLFSAANLKRHSGFTISGGIDAIYKTDYSVSPFVPNASLFVKLSSIGIDVGISPKRILDSTRAAASLSFTANCDSLVYDQIGKLGIGGIDLSDDGTELYVTNLKNRTIHKIAISNPANTAPTAGDVITFAIPDPGCNNGNFRPWAVKYYRGNLYVGVVCSGETSGDRNELSATVYKMNTSTGAFTSVLTFPITYKKGCTVDAIRCHGQKYYAWRNTYPKDSLYNDGTILATFPQPILTDIEFDIDGSMIIALMDRFGHQSGKGQAITNAVTTFPLRDPVTNALTASTTNKASSRVSGDILRAYYNSTTNTYTIESNGVVGPLSSTGVSPNLTGGQNKNQGYTNGEFYFNDNYTPLGTGSNDFKNTIGTHQEINVGSLAIAHGTNEIMSSCYDPTVISSGGIIWSNNTTGMRTDQFQLHDDVGGTAGKSNGIGDIEVLTPITPIEIGNRVWNDLDLDGLQEANEPGISGVTVELYDAAGTTLLASTTTTASGNFYFSSSTVSTLVPNTSFKLKIAAAHFNTTGLGPLAGFPFQTWTKRTVVGMPDYSDSDAAQVGGLVEIAFTTGGYGQSNHNLDFGFMQLSILNNCMIKQFNAAKKSLSVILNWQTDNSNATSFEVMHSTNGTDFSKIATVIKTNATQYEFVHFQTNLQTTNFYKIIAKNSAEIICTTDILQIEFKVKTTDLVVYPNPAHGVINVEIPDVLQTSSATTEIITMNGKTVQTGLTTVYTRVEKINLLALPKGYYLILLRNNRYRYKKIILIE